mgnify:CR=1 FL=1
MFLLNISKVSFLPLQWKLLSDFKNYCWCEDSSYSLYLQNCAFRKRGGAGDFVAGFVLGGVLFGALGCIFAPQVNVVLRCVFLSMNEILYGVNKHSY